MPDRTGTFRGLTQRPLGAQPPVARPNLTPEPCECAGFTATSEVFDDESTTIELADELEAAKMARWTIIDQWGFGWDLTAGGAVCGGPEGVYTVVINGVLEDVGGSDTVEVLLRAMGRFVVEGQGESGSIVPAGFDARLNVSVFNYTYVTNAAVGERQTFTAEVALRSPGTAFREFELDRLYMVAFKFCGCEPMETSES